MKTFAVSIPTKTYLKKYIHRRYGYPIAINTQTLFGMVVNSLLDKKTYQDTPDFQRDIRYNSFVDKIELVIPAYKVYSYKEGLNISKDKVIVINRYFELQFEEDLHRYCFNRVDTAGREMRYKGKGGCGYEKAINEFAEIYGIDLEIDITFECLKKSEYRLRKKIEKNSAVVVPSITAAPEFAFFK